MAKFCNAGLAGAFDMLKKKQDDDEEKEDPIQKAEREFFDIIKKVFLTQIPFAFWYSSLHVFFVSGTREAYCS